MTAGTNAARVTSVGGHRYLLPDINPIELAFAKRKTAPRAAAARTQATLDADALDANFEADALGWFRHCGYPLARST